MNDDKPAAGPLPGEEPKAAPTPDETANAPASNAAGAEAVNTADVIADAAGALEGKPLALVTNTTSQAEPPPEDLPPPGAPPPRDDLESCLLHLCNHFDIGASASSIRALLVGSVSTLGAKHFMQAAAGLGLVATPVGRPLADLETAEYPLVLMLNDGRAFAVVERPEAGVLNAHDPAAPAPVELKIDQLADVYDGLAIEVRPAPHRRVAFEKNWSALKAGLSATDQHWFWQPIRANAWIYLQVAVAAATTNLLGLGVSIFMMVVYDRVVPNGAIDSLVALTIGIMLVIGFDFIIRLLRSVFVDRAGERADLAMGTQIFDQLLNLQMKSKRGSAGAFANMLREFESLRDFFTSASIIAIVDLPFILLFVVVLFIMCGPVALVPALAVPLVLFVGIALQPLLARLAKQAFDEGQTKQGVLVETISGLETIKATAAAPIMRQRWESSIKYQAKVGGRSRLVTQIALNATSFAQQAAQIGMVFFGVLQIVEGKLSMGALVGGVMLCSRALAPLAQLAQTMTRFNQARTSYNSISKLMDAPSERPLDRQFVRRPDLVGKIELRGVSFKYPGQVSDAIDNVSFTIGAGERVAILGRIGSGKSTVARLLLGLYEPDKGAVLVDDTDIRQIDPVDLRTKIGSVLQDIWLFTGSIRQNIAAGARRTTDEDVLRAATVSGTHDFVSQHPQGYELVLAERGEGLSGGQRQSVAIARALVGNPTIVLMDEPTSAMDMQSEVNVVNRLKHVTRGKTVIMVTHRSSLLDLVDRVIVLDRGKVVADGPKSILQHPSERAASA